MRAAAGFHWLLAGTQGQNPHLAWNDAPDATKSFTLICHDCDVPRSTEDVNQEGREIADSLPRIDFFHWVLFDIPATTREIQAGEHSDGVTARGKSGPRAANGYRHGINDYKKWFMQDPNMSGDYYGYDGPCPPWNDARLHRYVFSLYALDVSWLDVHGELNGASVKATLAGHVLAKAVLIGTYSLNPKFQASVMTHLRLSSLVVSRRA